MTTTNIPTLDEAKLEAVVGKAVVDRRGSRRRRSRGYGASTIIMALAFEHLAPDGTCYRSNPTSATASSRT